METVSQADDYDFDPSDEADLQRIEARKGEHAVYGNSGAIEDFDDDEFAVFGKHGSVPYVS